MLSIGLVSITLTVNPFIYFQFDSYTCSTFYLVSNFYYRN